MLMNLYTIYKKKSETPAARTLLLTDAMDLSAVGTR